MNVPWRILDLSQIAGLNVVELHRVESSAQSIMLGGGLIRTALDSFPSVLFLRTFEQSRRGPAEERLKRG